MRVAMVSEHASPLATLGGVDAGGQNVHVAALARELGRRGVNVVVHTRRDGRSLPRRVRMAPGVVVDHVEAGPPASIPKDDLLPFMGAFADDLRRQWERERPDVVHAHFWMSGLAAISAATSFDIPVVQTFHALGVVKRRHQGAADTSPADRLAIEETIAREVTHIVATCSDEAFELARLGADRKRITVVPCGVDLARFGPDGPAIARCPGTTRLVSIGRLVKRKGVEDVIAAMADVPAAELLIAGGPAASDLTADADARRLAEAASKHGVQDRVRLLGRLDHDDVASLLRSSDIAVCVPWYEPFGIVPLEAMACAVPVVASSVGGLVDTVVDGVTGLRVPPREPRALAAALRRLVDDEPYRRRLGVAGHDRARRRYTWERVADATLSVYRGLVRGRVLVSRGVFS